MKINWKLRLKNKTTLLALVAGVVSLVYIVLGILGIVPPVAEDQIMEIVAAILNALALLGVVVDPTTSGVNDSERAMDYQEPA